MASFDSVAMLQYVQALVAGLSGMQQSSIGAPESQAARVSAYATLGDLTPRPKANQLAYRNPEVLVMLTYRVASAEQSAELLIGQLVDELTAAVYADRTLGGTVQSCEMDMSDNHRNPPYVEIGAEEVRGYVVRITGLQTATTP